MEGKEPPAEVGEEAVGFVVSGLVGSDGLPGSVGLSDGSVGSASVGSVSDGAGDSARAFVAAVSASRRSPTPPRGGVSILPGDCQQISGLCQSAGKLLGCGSTSLFHEAVLLRLFGFGDGGFQGSGIPDRLSPDTELIQRITVSAAALDALHTNVPAGS